MRSLICLLRRTHTFLPRQNNGKLKVALTTSDVDRIPSHRHSSNPRPKRNDVDKRSRSHWQQWSHKVDMISQRNWPPKAALSPFNARYNDEAPLAVVGEQLKYGGHVTCTYWMLNLSSISLCFASSLHYWVEDTSMFICRCRSEINLFEIELWLEQAASNDWGTIYAETGCVDMCSFRTAGLMFLNMYINTGHDIKARTQTHAEIANFPTRCLIGAWKALHLEMHVSQVLAPCWEMCNFRMGMGSC